MNRYRQMYALILAYVTAILIGVGSVVYTGIAVGENNRKWCDLLIPLDDAYTGNPQQRPQTAIGKQVAASIHRLRTDFECE